MQSVTSPPSAPSSALPGGRAGGGDEAGCADRLCRGSAPERQIDRGRVPLPLRGLPATRRDRACLERQGLSVDTSVKEMT